MEFLHLQPHYSTVVFIDGSDKVDLIDLSSAISSAPLRTVMYFLCKSDFKLESLPPSQKLKIEPYQSDVEMGIILGMKIAALRSNVETMIQTKISTLSENYENCKQEEEGNSTDDQGLRHDFYKGHESVQSVIIFSDRSDQLKRITDLNVSDDIEITFEKIKNLSHLGITVEKIQNKHLAFTTGFLSSSGSARIIGGQTKRHDGSVTSSVFMTDDSAKKKGPRMMDHVESILKRVVTQIRAQSNYLRNINSFINILKGNIESYKKSLPQNDHTQLPDNLEFITFRIFMERGYFENQYLRDGFETGLVNCLDDIEKFGNLSFDTSRLGMEKGQSNKEKNSMTSDFTDSERELVAKTVSGTLKAFLNHMTKIDVKGVAGPAKIHALENQISTFANAKILKYWKKLAISDLNANLITYNVANLLIKLQYITLSELRVTYDIQTIKEKLIPDNLTELLYFDVTKVGYRQRVADAEKKQLEQKAQHELNPKPAKVQRPGFGGHMYGAGSGKNILDANEILLAESLEETSSQVKLAVLRSLSNDPNKSPHHVRQLENYIKNKATAELARSLPQSAVRKNLHTVSQKVLNGLADDCFISLKDTSSCNSFRVGYDFNAINGKLEECVPGDSVSSTSGGAVSTTVQESSDRKTNNSWRRRLQSSKSAYLDIHKAGGGHQGVGSYYHHHSLHHGGYYHDGNYHHHHHVAAAAANRVYYDQPTGYYTDESDYYDPNYGFMNAYVPGSRRGKSEKKFRE